MTHPLSGSLLGTAAGDAYGLPYEGLSPRRIGKRFVPRRYALIPLLHGGMVSDDTEHAVMAAQAWIDGAGDPEIFRRSLRGRLKWWFARLPAGIGLATLRSCLKMWLGLGRTGVYSAGNGPAMCASVLGVLCDDLDGLCRLVKISTELTHTVPAVSGTWCEPLLTPDFFAALAKQADEARQSGRPQKAQRFGGMATFARNLLMMPVVLAHGFRRLLPPY